MEEDDKKNLNETSEPLLNSDEIADLLKENNSLKGTRLLTDTSKISYERLPMLEVVMDRLVRLLSTSLRNFTSDTVQVTLDDTRSVRFGDYLQGLSTPTLLGIFVMEEWSTTALITVESRLAYTIIDALLGGKQSKPTLIDNRPFTTIECNLIERLMRVILSDFSKSFDLVAPLHFRLERLEVNPHFATIVRPANASVLSSINVNMNGRGGVVELLLPYESLEPGRDKLLQTFMGEQVGQDNIWESHLSSEVWEATVALDAVLDDVSLSLADVLAWQPNTKILLKASSTSSVHVMCGDTLIFKGKMGQKKGHISIKVEQNYIQKRKET